MRKIPVPPDLPNLIYSYLELHFCIRVHELSVTLNVKSLYLYIDLVARRPHYQRKSFNKLERPEIRSPEIVAKHLLPFQIYFICKPFSTL